MHPSDIIGSIAAIAMVFGYLPQTVRTVRTRSTDDIATGTFLMMGFGLLRRAGHPDRQHSPVRHQPPHDDHEFDRLRDQDLQRLFQKETVDARRTTSMKTYDFDRIVDRHGTNAVKYDTLTDVFGSKELLPLWVADMDFATPDFILDALRRRLDHPVLGYTQLPDDYWPQIAVWIEARHGWRPDPAWMRFIPGIVKGIGMAVLALTRPGDKVVIQPPVYHPFRLVPEQMGRRVVCNPLRRTGDRYEMDFEQLEALLDDDCRLLLLSNPHNPAGIVWPEETLRRLAAICDRRGIVVVSDEIHCDMALYGHRHRPFASVSDAAAHCSVTFGAPTKTFNIAGVVSSYAIVPDEALRRRFFGWLEAGEFHEAPLLSVVATRAAFTPEGDAWRRQMLRYVEANVDFTDDFLRRYVPRIRAIRPEASFLVWLDCRELGLAHDALVDLFVARAGLALNDGEMFGPGGEGHMRLNVGLPRIRLAEALERLRAAVDAR